MARPLGIGVPLALLVALVGCRMTDAPSSPPTTSALATAFTTSASSANVPRDLLVAIAKVEDGLRVPKLRTPSLDDAIPTAGPLQLRHAALDSLARGAALVNATEYDLRSDSDRALTAGALVVAELGKKHGATSDLASWGPVLAELSGFADAPHRDAYVHEVFATLASGGTFEGRDGPITLDAHDLPPTLTFDLTSTLRFAANAQYPGAEVFEMSCTGKCATTRSGEQVQYVVIHDTEASWKSSTATLQNDPGKSVQYIIDVDGHVAQFVAKGVADPENITAYHCGNLLYNQRSVGIEHIGYATQPFPEAQYAASAKLVDYLASKYNVPRDRGHIIGHDQVPDGPKIGQDAPPCEDAPKACETSGNYGGSNNHTDPGVWEWSTYMARIGGTAKCNDATSLWECSTGTTSRYRCENDAGIAIEPCTSACNPTDGGATNEGDGICTLAPATTVTPPTVTADASTASDPPKADSGCAMTTRGTDRAPSALLVAGLGLVLAKRRRGRRHGPLDGMDVVVR